MSIKQNFPTIRPTLNLDFANSQAVDSRITFTRASAATLTDAQGILKTIRDNKPRIDFNGNTGECRGLLIEEQRTNLVTYSEEFSYGWGKTASSVIPNIIVAPNGTITASKLVEDTTAAVYHYTQRGAPLGGSVDSSPYVFSIFAKAGERNRLRLFDNNQNTSGDSTFNLSTGTVVQGTGTITSVGNGWYRCTIYPLKNYSTNSNVFVLLDNGSTSSYTGNGTSGLFIWGAQIEAGTFPTSYVPSTTTFTSRASSATYFDSTGVLRTAPANNARYGYESPYKQVDFYSDASNNVAGNSQIAAGTVGTLRSQGLILEPAATNLVTYSYNLSTLNTGYYLTTATASNFAVTTETTAPDNTYTASKFIFTGANDRVDQGYGTVPAAGWYTLSAWLKGVAGTVVQLSLLTSTGGNVEPAVYLTGQWQRFSVRKYFNSGEALRVHAPIIRSTMGNSVATNTGETGIYATYVYVWGLQIESGYVATSYIPTYGATATRAADVSTSAATTRAQDTGTISGAAFKAFHNYNEYSIVFEMARIGQTSTDSTLWQIGNGTGNMQMYQYRNSGYISLYAATNNHSTNQAGANSSNQVLVTSVFSKFAGGVALNNYASVAAGSLGYTDTSALVPQDVDTFYLGNLSGHYKKITYYPKRLSNTQLQALTV
jgi:hypothetical protein